MAIDYSNPIEELSDILNNDEVIYRNGYTPAELRKLFVKSKLPDFVDVDKLYKLAKRIVDLSSKGLTERGLSEEVFLTPLYERISRRTNPAKSLYDMLERGHKLEEIINYYSEI